MNFIQQLVTLPLFLKLHLYLSPMFKVLLVFLTSLFFNQCAKSQSDTLKVFRNRIDAITSSKDIERLLKQIDPSFSTFRVNDSLQFSDARCKCLSDSLQCKPWTKADFDGNGFTDLLVTGNWDDHAVFCILDLGYNKFVVNRLTRKIFQRCTFPVVKRIDSTNIILYYSFDETGTTVIADTLIYKFGDFVEYNPRPKYYNIERISFSTTECFGMCPQFSIDIDSSRTSTYDAIKYNKKSGKFTATIDESIFQKLFSFLNYINFPQLKNNYSVNWTDDQSCTLTVTYNNGQVKTIHDYGLLGTFGLNRLYQKLFGLRDNQDWKAR